MLFPRQRCCTFCPFLINNICLITYNRNIILNLSTPYQNYINSINIPYNYYRQPEEFMPLRSNKIIPIKTVIEKGSVWDSPKGRELITEEIDEARRIWFANAGVKVHFLKNFIIAQGDPNKPITTQDIKNYAITHHADKNMIVVVFRNKSVEESRAWTEPSLVNENTPVIIVGSGVFNNPGTKRDLAHELGHVLLRSEKHSTGINDLMNVTWGSTIGDKLSEDEIKKANKYPD